MSDEKRLERIENKIDGLGERMHSLDTTSAKQQVSLDEHIRRTALLEAEIKPIKKHVDMVNGALKLIGILSVILGIYKALK